MKYLALSVLLLSSCAASTVYRQPGAPVLAPTMPAEVRVYSGEPKGSYVILGSVAADRLGGADDAVNLLKEKAASLGANAVISVRLTKIDLASGRTGLPAPPCDWAAS